MAKAKDCNEEMMKIRKEIVDFHGEMVLLENYSALNYTGNSLKKKKTITMFFCVYGQLTSISLIHLRFLCFDYGFGNYYYEIYIFFGLYYMISVAASLFRGASFSLSYHFRNLAKYFCSFKYFSPNVHLPRCYLAINKCINLVWFC